MRTVIALTLMLLAANWFPAVAQDKPQLRVLSEVSLDMDGDGTPDRVATVLVGAADKPEKREDGGYWLRDGETVDLYFYMNNGDKSLDLAATPSFVKKDIFNLGDDSSGLVSVVYPLQQKGKAAITLHNCHGCGASISWEETLTIVTRNKQFLVAGLNRSWDENIHTAHAGVETTTGQCDINFLTGRGVASEDVALKPKPLEQKFKPIKLDDWSIQKYPKACSSY